MMQRNHERLALCQAIRRRYLPGLAPGRKPRIIGKHDDPGYCRAVRAYCTSDALFHQAGGDSDEALTQLAAARWWRAKERALKGPPAGERGK